MQVDFLNEKVILNQSQKLKIKLTEAEAKIISDLFNQNKRYVRLTVEGMRTAAKFLSQCSHKSIKLNHGLEIMSREFFKLPWNKLLPKLEQEEQEMRNKELLRLLSYIKEVQNEVIFFVPGISSDERSLIKSFQKEARIIEDIDLFKYELDRLHKELDQIRYEGKEEKPISVMVPYYIDTTTYFDFSDFKSMLKTDFWDLSFHGRVHKIIIHMASSKPISYTFNERTPEEFHGPKEVNFSQKIIFKVSKGSVDPLL